MVNHTVSPDSTCPTCGLTAREFVQLRRAGCSACYRAFSAALVELLPPLHQGPVHAGRRSARGQGNYGRVNVPYPPLLLNVALQEALRAENYELAAALRDLAAPYQPPAPSTVEAPHGQR